MNEQIGWRGLAERLKNEAPRYVQLLPELPRLVHQALQRDSSNDARALELLVEEQRRLNRTLSRLLWLAAGFAAGVVVALILLRLR